MAWPQDMPRFDDVFDIMNNSHSFPEGDVRNATKCVRTNFLDDDDTFALKLLNDCLFCLGSNDSHVADSQTEFDDAWVYLLVKWQWGLPIDNDEGQEVQGEAADVGEEDADVVGEEFRLRLRMILPYGLNYTI
ncbi:hypothetical protein LIER_38152 [Lithospermum erythrorhizon]|uniref:Uncharacterized protein n=1 Tax=Lithospermum erythrorhizon TaxID=34254 RepID=A0AAV3PXF0_LITER